MGNVFENVWKEFEKVVKEGRVKPVSVEEFKKIHLERLNIENNFQKHWLLRYYKDVIIKKFSIEEKRQ